VFDRIHVLELDETGSGYGIDGLAGGVRDEVEMKVFHAAINIPAVDIGPTA
jgi:hypothetical protein